MVYGKMGMDSSSSNSVQKISDSLRKLKIIGKMISCKQHRDYLLEKSVRV